MSLIQIEDWIPVSERLPDEEGHVYIHDGENPGLGYFLFEDADQWRAEGGYWMPIPPLRKALLWSGAEGYMARIPGAEPLASASPKKES